MKFESHILACLFVVCFTVCALVMGAMIHASPASVHLAGANQATTVVPAG